jgi:hypothetical protein
MRMRNFIYLLTLLVFVSCDKNDDDTPEPGPKSTSELLTGTWAMDGVYDLQGALLSPGIDTLIIYKNNNGIYHSSNAAHDYNSLTWQHPPSYFKVTVWGNGSTIITTVEGSINKLNETELWLSQASGTSIRRYRKINWP